MHRGWLIVCLLMAGCSQEGSRAEQAGQGSGASPAQSAPATHRTGEASGSQTGEARGSQSSASADESLPPDLRTRSDGSDWPGFLGPTGDSKSSETGIVTAWPSKGPKLLWEMRVGVGYGMPAVSRGRLYQFDRRDDRETLTCFHSETGEQLWQVGYPSDYQDLYGYDNGPRCCPLIDGNRVYLHGAEGMLHCVSAEDGKVLWKVDTANRFNIVQNFFGVGSTPVIEGDLLIVQVGGSLAANRNTPPGRLDLVEGDNSGVVAFNKFTGEVAYQLSDELASYASPTLATIDGRRWCFVLARGGLLGFDPATGKQHFHYPWRADILESVNASNPVVAGDMVFISECYGPGSSLLRVRPGGYDLLWADQRRARDKVMQTHWNTPIHHDGYLYGSSGRNSNDAELRCIELRTGKVMWSEPGLSRSSLLMVDGHFICLTEDGQLLLLRVNPEKFDLVARATPELPEQGMQLPLGLGRTRLLNYPAWAAPILSHGLLYVRGSDRLACFELIAKP